MIRCCCMFFAGFLPAALFSLCLPECHLLLVTCDSFSSDSPGAVPCACRLLLRPCQFTPAPEWTIISCNKPTVAGQRCSLDFCCWFNFFDSGLSVFMFCCSFPNFFSLWKGNSQLLVLMVELCFVSVTTLSCMCVGGGGWRAWLIIVLN